MAPDTSPPRDPSAKPRIESLGLGSFAVELILPTALSAAGLLTAASYLPWWNLHGRLGLGVFGALLVALSFVLSVWMDGLTLAGRRKAGRARLLNRADPWSRLVKFALGGVLVPIGVFVGANLVKLPDRRTPMSLAAQLTVRKTEPARAELLGSAVLKAREGGAKVAGIAALQALSSAGALNQLFRILAEDPAVVRGGPEARALSKAFASYGKLATPRLLERFAAAGHGAEAASPLERDTFERYFLPGFEALRSDVDASGLDPASRTEELSRLQLAEAQLKRNLQDVEEGPAAGHEPASVAGFVFRTFLEMSPGEAADLLPFARQVGADATCSDALRGQAFLLVARLGGKGDLDLLYEQLGSPSPALVARALQAIAALNARLAHGTDKG